MSPAPQPIRPLHRPSPVTGSGQHADVIEIHPWMAGHPLTVPGHGVEPSADTVVLGLGQLPAHAHVDRQERYHSAPPPPRVRHRAWMLSSIVIAGGGVLAVMIAGAFGDVPIVATVALLATVLCGAILVAAQVTDEVRLARSRRQRLDPP